MKVRVLGPPGSGFGLGGGRPDAYAGDVIELEDHVARAKIQAGIVEEVQEPKKDEPRAVAKPSAAESTRAGLKDTDKK